MIRLQNNLLWSRKHSYPTVHVASQPPTLALGDTYFIVVQIKIMNTILPIGITHGAHCQTVTATLEELNQRTPSSSTPDLKSLFYQIFLAGFADLSYAHVQQDLKPYRIIMRNTFNFPTLDLMSKIHITKHFSNIYVAIIGRSTWSSWKIGLHTTN